MTSLVIGNDAFFFIADQARLALRAHDDPFDGFFQFRLADRFFVAASRQDGAFIDQVFQIGAHETGCAARNGAEVHVWLKGLAARVHLQDGFAPAHIGTVKRDAAVETSGAQQSRVEDIRPVGGGHYDHVGIRIEAVHLDQHLIESLFALIVRTAQAGAALATYGINLINKYDAGRVALGLIEQVTHPAGSNTHEHFNKFRTRDREEGHTCLAGNGFGKQGFACAGRPYQQNALRDARAQLNELLRLFEELNHFLKFIFGFIDPGHIFKCDGGMLSAEHARL